MGNLITTSVAVFAPLISQNIIVPGIFHPYSRMGGGIPWTPPGLIKRTIGYWFGVLGILTGVGWVSSMMSTSKECGKVELWTSFVGTRWLWLFGIVGLIIPQVFPVLKVMPLTHMTMVPYADQMVNGAILAILVLIGGFLSNAYGRKHVCEESENKPP